MKIGDKFKNLESERIFKIIEVDSLSMEARFVSPRNVIVKLKFEKTPRYFKPFYGLEEKLDKILIE